MDVSVWKLKWKSRWWRWWDRQLNCLATAAHTVGWTDQYRRPTTTAGPPYHLHVEVQCAQVSYEFGSGMGTRLTITLTNVVVTQYQLTSELRSTKLVNRYYGLDREDLLALLQCELPWLVMLPNESSRST